MITPHDAERTAHFGGCLKRSYPSRAKALLAMDEIRRVQRQDHRRTKPGKAAKLIRRKDRDHPAMVCRAYECPLCGSWHLTSQGGA